MATGRGIPKLPQSGGEPRIIASRVNQLIDRGLHEMTEAVIGTWVDGRPVYRKVLGGVAGPNTTSTSVAHSVTSLGTVTSLKAVLDNATTQRPVPDYDGTNYSTINATDTNVVLTTNWNASAYTTYAIMEYTKTVD